MRVNERSNRFDTELVHIGSSFPATHSNAHRLRLRPTFRKWNMKARDRGGFTARKASCLLGIHASFCALWQGFHKIIFTLCKIVTLAERSLATRRTPETPRLTLFLIVSRCPSCTFPYTPPSAKPALFNTFSTFNNVTHVLRFSLCIN